MTEFESNKILVVQDVSSYELADGQSVNVNVFDDADINAAADAAQAVASKLIIAEGAVATYDNKNQKFFLNCDVFDTENGEGKFSYDYLIDSSLTYDLDVNGTFKSYQILLNNAKTVVSESGKLFAMGETLRVMGGTFTVQGKREEGADDPAASDIFTGSWGAGTGPGTATQIKSGYMQINQGAAAEFNDTVVFINAGWFNVDKATATFDNTYIYLGSGGSYAPIAVQIFNGAVVTLANNSTMVYDPEFTMNITVDAGSALLLSDSKISATSLTNNGTVTVSGKSTVDFGTLTGTYVRFDNATLVGDSNIVGNARAYNDFTLAGTFAVKQFNMYGTATVKKDAVLNGSTTIVGTGSKFTLENGGEISSRFFNVMGTADIAGNIALGHSDPRQKLLQVLEGGTANIKEDAVVTITRHNAIVNAGGTLNVAGGLVITADTVNVAPDRGGNLYNEGTVVLSEKAKVTMTTYTSENGIFEINVTDGWRGVATVVDAVAGTFSADDITINAADAADGLSYRIDEATGDLVIFNTDTDTLYLNSAYTGAFGKEVVGGKFSGINAFADIKSAVSAAQGGSKIVVESDVASDWFAQGEKVSGDLTISLADGVEAATLTANGEFRGADISADLNIGAGVTLDLAPAHSGTQNFATFSGKWDIDGTMIYGGADFDGIDLTVSKTGKFLSYGTDNTSFRNGSIVNVTGIGTAEAKMKEVQFRTGQFGGFYGETTFTDSNVEMAGTTVTQMTGKVTIDNTVVNSTMGLDFGGYRNGYDDAATGVDAEFVGVITNSDITAADLRFMGGVITITDSVIKTDADSNPNGIDGAWKNTGAFKVYEGAVVNFAGINTITVEGAVTNNGTINFTFDADSAPAANTLLINAAAASTYGTVTVTGAAAGYEAVAVGENLYLLDMSKIYVNSAYGEEGAELAAGLYLGINAFASFADFNKSDVSKGDRTVVYTYNGSNPAAKITVENEAGTLLSYTFDGKTYNFYSGSRTHEVALTQGGTYAFDFAKGDFAFTMVEVEKNSEGAEDIGSIVPDAAGNVSDDVAVSDVAGDKSYSFTVEDGTTVDFVCKYSDVKGTARVTLYDADGNKLSSKLFNKEGSFSAKELAAGDYKVVFSGYGMNPEAELTASFTLTATQLAVVEDSCISSLDDIRDNSNLFSASSGAVELTNWVGTEDTVDWFKVTDLAAGSHSFGVDVEGSKLAINLYSELNGRYTTLASFSVTDKSDDAADYSRTVKIAEGANLFVKVTGKGESSDYSISIA